MLPVEREFPEFVAGVAKGLYGALISDPNVFLLGIGGLFLGSSRRRPRGIATSLLLYVTFRRLDEYVDTGVQMTRIAVLMRQRSLTPTGDLCPPTR